LRAHTNTMDIFDSGTSLVRRARVNSTGSDASEVSGCSGSSLRDRALEAVDTSAQVKAMNQTRLLREAGEPIADEALTSRDRFQYELFGGQPVPDYGKLVTVVPAPRAGYADWCQFEYRETTAHQYWFLACLFEIGEVDQAAKLTKPAMHELMKIVGTAAFCDRFGNHALANLREFVAKTTTGDGSPYFVASDVLDEKRIGSVIAGKSAKKLFEEFEKKMDKGPPAPRNIAPPPMLTADAAQTRGHAKRTAAAGAAAEAPKKKKQKKKAAKKRAAKPASRAK